MVLNLRSNVECGISLCSVFYTIYKVQGSRGIIKWTSKDLFKA
jgi:hypothetical protein